jgi:hypothetical protein
MQDLTSFSRNELVTVQKQREVVFWYNNRLQRLSMPSRWALRSRYDYLATTMGLADEDE